MFRLGVLTAFAGTTLLLTTRLVPFLLIGSAVAGFGLAALFPIIAAVMSRDLGERGNRFGGFFFATGNLGGALIPFLVGVISSQAHSLRIGMSLALVVMVLMLAMSQAFAPRLGFASPERA